MSLGEESEAVKMEKSKESETVKTDSPSSLLREFVGSDLIAHYDSGLCWGCGELKTDPCVPDCLLERTRRMLCSCTCHYRERDRFSVDFRFLRGRGCEHCGLSKEEWTARERVRVLWRGAAEAAYLSAPRHSTSCAKKSIYAFTEDSTAVSCANCEWRLVIEFVVPDWFQAEILSW